MPLSSLSSQRNLNRMLLKNKKRDNKQCLLDTPRRVTVNKKESSKHKVKEKICIYTKAMALLKITKGNHSNSIGPVHVALRFSLFYICLKDRNVLARFDEIPSITLLRY